MTRTPQSAVGTARKLTAANASGALVPKELCSRARRALCALAFAVVALATAAGVARAGVLDQESVGTPGCFLSAWGPEVPPAFPGVPGGPLSGAQTITAGRTGVLDRVDLDLRRPPSRTGPLTVELREVLGGSPGTRVLASAALPAASVPTAFGFVAVEFARPASIAAGTPYAIVAHTTQANRYVWQCTVTDLYLRGQLFLSRSAPPPAAWEEAGINDARFRTYVAAPVAVEPPTSAPQRGGAAPLKAGACANARRGTRAADTLTGSPAGDLLRGLGRADRLTGLAGDDCLFGGAGADRLAGGPGSDRLYGGSGSDRLGGDAGDDRLSGGTGRDRISAGAGNDSVNPGTESDRIATGSGNDRVAARGGRRDTVDCGPGRNDVAVVDRRDRLRRCERVRRR